MDQITVSKKENEAEPTYQQGSNPLNPFVQDQGTKFVSNLVHKSTKKDIGTGTILSLSKLDGVISNKARFLQPIYDM